MSETQSVSFAAAQTKSRLRVYKVLFAVSILGDLAVAFWCIFNPAGFAHAVFHADPHPAAWPRLWGATLLGLQFLYWPGLRNPLFYRWPNWSSIAIKFFMAIVFLASGRLLYTFAAWDFGFGVILLVAYYRLLQAYIGGKP